MESKKHIIFIVDGYYPNYSANGICVKKVTDILKVTHNVTVICIKNQKGLPDIEEHDSINIVRIETGEFRARNYVNSILKKSKSKFKRALVIPLLRAVQVRRYLNTIISKENIINSFVKGYIKALKEVNGPIDLIVPVCFPFESIVAALEYKTLYYNSVKIVPCLFDKFSASEGLHRTEWNKKLKMQRHLILEKDMLEKSDSILATDDWEGHFKYYFSNYINDIEFIDIPALCPIERNSLIHYDDNEVHFAYTGSLDYRVRPAEYALKLLSSCITDKPEYILHMYVWGNCESIINRFVESKPKQIINHGSVSVETAHSALANADVLLSIGNTDITQKPSKIYEYMACGKPIIHLYHDENDPIIKILNKYGRACCLEQSETNIESNRVELIRFVEKYKGMPIITFAEVKNKFLGATPEYTVQILKSLVE